MWHTRLIFYEFSTISQMNFKLKMKQNSNAILKIMLLKSFTFKNFLKSFYFKQRNRKTYSFIKTNYIKNFKIFQYEKKEKIMIKFQPAMYKKYACRN